MTSPLNLSSLPTLNLTNAERIEFKEFVETECSELRQKLFAGIFDSAQEYASALNSAGDNDTTDLYREQLLQLIDSVSESEILFN